ncbi:hypothetical protein ACIQOF_11255 [Streptomyces sp. NPDC091265]|uniref:hypothetical protein n=1 Tax=unclassified Streptomyces TaxID=2593676 RepID=UPI00344F6A65
MRRTRGLVVAVGVAALALATTTTAHAEGRGDIRVTKTVVDHGTSVVVGTSKTIKYPIVMTIKDNSGIKGVGRVSTYNHTSGEGVAEQAGSATCVKQSATTSVCTAMMEIVPQWMAGYSTGDANTMAGTWTVNATVNANDRDYWISDGIASYKVKRAATLVTATPAERVRTGSQLKVTGKLARAHWEDLKYYGFTGQSVKLQFKKSGSSSYTTVKTVKSGTSGKLSATVTAASTGSWRWFFDGTSTTAQIISAGKTVRVGRPEMSRATFTQ